VQEQEEEGKEEGMVIMPIMWITTLDNPLGTSIKASPGDGISHSKAIR
jgi:hypothetical protein